MRAAIIALSAFVLLIGSQMPDWATGEGEPQQQSCKDQGTC